MPSNPAIQHTDLGQGIQSLQYHWLAPRGVCLTADHLLVADTARNDVTILRRVGQHFEHQCTLGNASGHREGCTASSLQYPSGIWSDGKRLAIADAWNHRVLLWHQLPTTDQCPADVILGQAHPADQQPNRTGLHAKPAADSLYWPYGVWSQQGQDLFIADTGNRRVLHFNHWPTETGQAADLVIGQLDFESKEYDPAQIIWPYSVKTSIRGELLISDTQYYRVHYWKHWKTAVNQPADVLFGQANHKQNGQNQYRLKPEANTLNWCYDAAFYNEQVLIADTGNSRILGYPSPLVTNMPAAHLWGQVDFQQHGEASLSLKQVSPDPTILYWPFSISIHAQELAVADTGKSRILIYPLNL